MADVLAILSLICSGVCLVLCLRPPQMRQVYQLLGRVEELELRTEDVGRRVMHLMRAGQTAPAREARAAKREDREGLAAEAAAILASQASPPPAAAASLPLEPQSEAERAAVKAALRARHMSH